MNNRTIRRKVISYFVGASVVLSVLFSMMALIFSYEVEDRLFQTLLFDEQQLVEQQLKDGLKPTPRLSFIEFYQTESALPRAIADVLKDEPNRIEFPGDDQQHYHLTRIDGGFLVAEVSEHLVVRKLRGEMLSVFVILLSIGLVAALLLALLSLRLAKRLLKPLDELMDIVNNAPVEKLPTHFAHRFETGEIAQFAKTLESALERIRAFITREQEFTRDVSHELRTPMSVIQGAITLLKASELTANQRDTLARLDQANLQMTQSLEGLLVLAREENNAPQNTQLLPLVERIALAHIDLIDGKPVELNIHIAAHARVPISEPALTLILSNLIKNAFIHTNRGHVTIDYQAGILHVSDTGSGFEPSVMTHAFEQGVKGSKSQGSGLGLAIVKRVCDKLNISIEFTSNTTGTRFTLTLNSA
jgi:signal transduction histidine kinase